MMSVKHITFRGEEFIYPTSHVNYVPASAINDAGSPDTVWIYPPDQPALPLNGGTIFVMNEHGKTVSRYDIGASAVPLGSFHSAKPPRSDDYERAVSEQRLG